MNKLWKINFTAKCTVKWVLSRLNDILTIGKDKPIHILFCMVDHYEPGTGNAAPDVEKERVKELLVKYPKLVKKHKDYAGNHPKRTWFFPPHYHRSNSLRELVSLCKRGYGEIELHIHHGKNKPDTAENLEKTIRQCIDEYSKFGIFGTENGTKKYGFIHGDWALDNSRNGKFCGVNNEIQILEKTGCYCDFTFPSNNEANPAQINSIYYAKDNPDKPKSHNKGVCVKALSKEEKDGLMIVQGPLHPFLKDKKTLRVFGDSINGNPVVTPERIDLWIKTGIHVKGKRDWVIIKTHTHGAIEAKAVLGKEMDEIYSHLETKYNDGSDYILHYVTARELYNVIKAVEAGEPCDDPEKYRDYKIQPPTYDPLPEIAEASDKLKELVSKTYS